NGLGNKLHGIALEGTAIQNNLIGGTNAGQGNIIANNSAAGVAVFGDPTSPVQNIGNGILVNSIFNNKGLRIDLVSITTYPTDDGVTANTPGGPHLGPNALQNFPLLTAAIPTPQGGTTIYGSLNSIPDTTFRIEFFANDSANPSGFGEGKAFLGFANVTTD